MKKFTYAFVLSALAFTAVPAFADDSTDAEEIVITVSTETGAFASSNSAGTWCDAWTSTATPGVKVSCGVNNFDGTASGSLLFAAGKAGSATLTISSTSSEYYVAAYSFDASRSGSDWTDSSAVTYNPNSKGAVSITTDPTTISASGLDQDGSATIVVSGSNLPVLLDNFTVTLAERTVETLVPTTITADGEFAEDTQWYTMAIGAAGYVFTNQLNDVGAMPLSETTLTYADSQLWCFVGNDTDGYRFYNKAEGTSKQLSAPANPASLGTTGANAYVILADPTEETTRTYLWDFQTSTNLSTTAYYLNVHGSSNLRINNRSGNLAFWTGGADAGSSIVLKKKPTLGSLVENNVWTISESPLVQLVGPAGGTVTVSNGEYTLSEGEWTFSTPEGTVLGSTSVVYCNGMVTSHVSNGWDNSNHTITGPASISFISYELITALEKPSHAYPVFVYTNSAPYSVQYRIPTITTVAAGEHKGRLVAINDYRYCGGDIGAGRIDLYMSYSDDNGATWSEPGHMLDANGNPVSKGSGVSSQSSDGNGIITSGLDCGYGDPASVSDRETGAILVVACAGRMGFFSSTRANPQPSVRWWSYDGGQTWTEPDDNQYKQIYELLGDDAEGGAIKAQFVGSGRMVQSKHIKVGEYYRIYCVNSGRAEDGTLRNWVLYSDDFGHNWKVLGGAAKPGVSYNGDEPKCEELPDGSIILAARGNGGNRNFNIFRYTDIENGEGNWGTQINTNMGMGSITACNGEIMIVPVKNTTTNEQLYLALQSFPYGGSRKNVSIAYKALTSAEDYDTPSDFANWDGRYQVSTTGSGYSTMTLTDDNCVGFFYEEDTYGVSYCDVYAKISIETLTNGAYTYCADDDFAVAKAAAAEMMKLRYSTEAQAPTDGKQYVGRPTAANSSVQEVIDEYAAATGYAYDVIAKFNNAINSTEILTAEAGKIYRFTSAHDGTYSSLTSDYYLTIDSSGVINVTTDADDANALFMLTKADDSREDFLVYSTGAQKFFPATSSTTETTMSAVAHAYAASPYYFQSQTDGHTAVISSIPGNTSYPAIHMGSQPKIVIWTAAAAASQWYMELMGDAESDIDAADRVFIKLSVSSASLEVGATKTLKATIQPTWLTDQTVAWSSEDATIASVDESGVVTAVGAGTTNIVATVGATTKSCAITVTDPQSSIEEVAVSENGTTELYDLQGRRVNNASHGIYITADGKKVRI